MLAICLNGCKRFCLVTLIFIINRSNLNQTTHLLSYFRIISQHVMDIRGLCRKFIDHLTKDNKPCSARCWITFNRQAKKIAAHVNPEIKPIQNPEAPMRGVKMSVMPNI